MSRSIGRVGEGEWAEMRIFRTIFIKGKEHHERTPTEESAIPAQSPKACEHENNANSLTSKRRQAEVGTIKVLKLLLIIDCRMKARESM